MKIFKLAVLMAAVVSAVAAKAQIQVPLPTNIALSTNVGTTTFGVALTNTGTGFNIPQGVDLGFLVSQTCTNFGTSNNVYGFDYAVNGQWTTGQPLTLTVANAGSNTVATWTFVNRTNLVGVRQLRLDTYTTYQTNPPLINGIWIDWARP